jgi:hypothetical protein
LFIHAHNTFSNPSSFNPEDTSFSSIPYTTPALSTEDSMDHKQEALEEPLALQQSQKANKPSLQTTLSWMDNHMTTEDGVYVSGWESEGYRHYQLADRWWLVGGWNYLEPVSVKITEA